VQALALGKTTGCGSGHAVNPAGVAARALELHDLQALEDAKPSATTPDKAALMHI
jgi:hypothetical protein